MGLKINGSTSGSIEIDVPAVAGTDTSITIPAKNGGTFIVEESTGNIDLGPLDINGSASDDSVNIDGSGRLLVGTSTAIAGKQSQQRTVQIAKAQASTNQGLGIYHFDGGGQPPNLEIGLSKNNTLGSHTTVSSGDNCGSIKWSGSDGTGFVELASINGVCDGTPGTNDMPGRLVFSTTADGASSPTERVKIFQDGSFLHHGNVFYATSPVTTSTFPVFAVYTGGSNIGSIGTVKCRIHGDGDVENVNNSYGAISDIKLKENISDANSQWDDLKALQVRKYNFKEETSYSTHTQIGLVAQEAELVSPGLVSESPDRDEEGNDLGTVTKSVNYSVLYMKAVKALQEAMDRIEALEARLTAAGIE